MGFSKIMQLYLIVLVMSQNVSSMFLQTDDVILLGDKSFILNCTYLNDSMEDMLDNSIRWQKQDGVEFKNIAMFSPPGKKEPGIVKEMQPLYANRTELIAPSISLSAVMIIRNPVCSDKGIYRCQIGYFVDYSEHFVTSDSVVDYNAKPKAPEKFEVFPNELEENHSISVTCIADVGNTRGYIQIWKFFNNSNTADLIYTSNSTTNKSDNCTEIIDVTTTFTVTKYDNEAMFRCSSQNNFTQGPGPSKDSSKITVIYGPSNTRIQASFSNSHAFIGDHVNMECISDGNPNPNYTWKFNFTDVVSDAKYTFSADKSGLSFTITNITDSGHYQCVASKYFNGKLFNGSSNVTLIVQEQNNAADSSLIEQPCSKNLCLIIENCVLKNGRVNCSVNIWSVIAIFFIALTFIFCTINILILSRTKKQKRDNINKGFQIGDVHVSYTRETLEDFGGYADPKDVKRPENGQIKSDKDVRDNPYADPVDFQTQYAVVQKNWETPAKSSKEANSSNSSNLVNNMDSPNTGNPSSSPEATNPKKSLSDEKSSDSIETSKTISKPPNVDQSPTNYINLLLE